MVPGSPFALQQARWVSPEGVEGGQGSGEDERTTDLSGPSRSEGQGQGQDLARTPPFTRVGGDLTVTTGAGWKEPGCKEAAGKERS